MASCWAVTPLSPGREYRFPTFTLPRHPSRLFLFSLDASKLLGFRDTYIFFLRNPDIYRINATDEDREFLKAHGLVPTQLRNRSISLVMARNIFRMYGHKVVRRGRPWHDDYFIGNTQEPPFAQETENEVDEIEYGVYDFAKALAAQEGGPIKRQGPAILGFSKPIEDDEPFVPSFIPPEIKADGWMLKCAVSAADYNRRLVRNRPTSFLDLHTNIEQVSANTQPKRIKVQMAKDETTSFRYIQDKVSILNDDDTYTTVHDSSHPSLFPIALMPSQYQDVIPL